MHPENLKALRWLVTTLNDPLKRMEYLFGQQMKPCPKCGSYDICSQYPTKRVGIWESLFKPYETPLEGPCYIECKNCGHKGPAVNCYGAMYEEIWQDKDVKAEMKRLWNQQTSIPRDSACSPGESPPSEGSS